MLCRRKEGALDAHRRDHIKRADDHSEGHPDSLALKPADRVVLVMEGNHAILYLLRGTILDAAASVKSPAGKKPLDFRAVRGEVQRRIAKRAVTRGR